MFELVEEVSLALDAPRNLKACGEMLVVGSA